MQQEKIEQQNSEEVLTLEKRAPETTEPLPFGRRETIFTMIGVLSVVFLAMLDQFCLEAGDTLNEKPGLRESFSFAC